MTKFHKSRWTDCYFSTDKEVDDFIMYPLEDVLRNEKRSLISSQLEKVERIIEKEPEKYEICSACTGSGKTVYMPKFSASFDGKVEKCVMCNGKGYVIQQNWKDR